VFEEPVYLEPGATNEEGGYDFSRNLLFSPLMTGYLPDLSKLADAQLEYIRARAGQLELVDGRVVFHIVYAYLGESEVSDPATWGDVSPSIPAELLTSFENVTMPTAANDADTDYTDNITLADVQGLTSTIDTSAPADMPADERAVMDELAAAAGQPVDQA
jgi:hypothetical protein